MSVLAAIFVIRTISIGFLVVQRGNSTNITCHQRWNMLASTQDKKMIVRTAIPVIIHGIVQHVQILIDQAFLGNLNSDYFTVLGNVVAPFWMTLGTVFMLNVGITILITQNIGAGRLQRACDVASSAMKFNSVPTLALFIFWFFAGEAVFQVMGLHSDFVPLAATYVRVLSFGFIIMGLNSAAASIMQGIGTTGPMMIAGFIRNGLNIVLDWVLIYGKFGAPEMGLSGAALATVISDYVATAYIVAYLFARKNSLGITIHSVLSARLEPYIKSIKVGAPIGIGEILWNMGNVVMVRYLNMVGPTAAGIFMLVINIEMLPVLLYLGFAKASTTYVGRKIGERKEHEALGIGVTCFLYSFVISAVIALAFLLIPHQILSLFTGDEATVARAVPFLMFLSAVIFGRLFNILSGQSINGYGDTKWMLYTQLFGTFYILSAAYLLAFVAGLGLWGIFMALLSDEVVRAIVNTARFLKGPNRRGFTIDYEKLAY